MVIRRTTSLALVSMLFVAAATVVVSPDGPAVADTGCQTPVAPSQVSGVYEIDSAAKLQWAKDTGTMSNNYKLTANIDMSGCTWSNGIGTGGSNGVPYTGTFDGNSYTISNLAISGGSQQFLGLFDDLNGSVRDLTLASPSVSGTNDWKGSLAGRLRASGSISNVTATSVAVSGRQLSGGLVGQAASGSIISSVTVSGTVTGTGSWAGGIAGDSQATITSANSSVNVSGTDQVGGLAGAMSYAGTFTNSSSTGNVSGSYGVAGAVGSVAGVRPSCGTLTGVTTSGTVNGRTHVGGLIGDANCYFINQSSSSVTLTASADRAGGLVGYENNSGDIDRSFFTGQVQATEIVGGIGGLLRGAISNTYSTGSVTATSATNGGRAGGLIGWMNGSTLTNSFAAGLVTPPSGSSTTTGGLIGNYASGTITSSVWDISATGRSTSGGSAAKGFTTQQLRDYVLYNSDNLNWSITDGISSGNGVTTGTAWSICSGANSGYPFLTRQSLTGTCQPTMAYNGNGNTSGTAPSDTSTPYSSGATVTVVGNTGTLTKTGNIFVGWNTKADGTGTPYSAGDTFTITSPVMLFAQWVAAPTIVYRSNGGTGSIASQTSSSGSSVTLSSGTGFIRSGYILSRWDTSSMGNGTSYSLGQSITMPAGGLNLWAIWTVNPSATTTTTTTTAVTTTTALSSTTTSAPTVATTTPAQTTPATTILGNAPSTAAGGQTGGGSVSNSLPPQSSRATTTSSVAGETTTTTVAIEPDVPDVRGVGTGDVGATLGGRAVTPQISDDDGSIVISVGNATVRYTIVDASGARRMLSAARAAELRSGDVVTVQLTGFAAEATATSWLVPGDVPLGSTELSGGAGTITGTVPDDVTSGTRRLVTAADAATDEPLVIAYGVDVAESLDGGPSWSLVFLVFLGLAAIGGLLIPAARRRRES